MFSFAVTSLFIHGRISETINCLCASILENTINIDVPMNRLRRLLFICTQNVQFKSSREIYCKINGVAMRSSREPRVRRHIIHGEIGNYPSHQVVEQFALCKRYVDDTVYVVDDNVDTGY